MLIVDVWNTFELMYVGRVVAVAGKHHRDHAAQSWVHWVTVVIGCVSVVGVGVYMASAARRALERVPVAQSQG